ncbi:MAG: membrane protein insertase YidC, partial [Alphaproteobacteria bacterium]|nr:membrane protein insertase YidC [Alphaproteobacteria bacterium]
MKDDMKSFYIAVFLSLFVVWGVNYFFPKPATTVSSQQKASEEETVTVVNNDADEVENEKTIYQSTETAVAKNQRFSLKNNSLSGTVRLEGARFDNLYLLKYKQTLDNDSPNVELLAPSKTASTFFAEYGWLSADKNLLLPNSDTQWTIVGNQELTPETPVTLEWNNGQGLIFRNEISLDENYLFNIKQTVENNSGAAVTLVPY